MTPSEARWCFVVVLEVLRRGAPPVNLEVEKRRAFLAWLLTM